MVKYNRYKYCNLTKNKKLLRVTLVCRFTKNKKFTYVAYFIYPKISKCIKLIYVPLDKLNISCII